MVLLGWWFGPSNTLWQMGAFFSKAALMTFGGAYAVLPYVFQGAVETYHWLTPAQMMDGLALGESTPGPLIMVVTFIGFLGGHVQPVMAGEHGALTTKPNAAAVISSSCPNQGFRCCHSMTLSSGRGTGCCC